MGGDYTHGVVGVPIARAVELDEDCANFSGDKFVLLQLVTKNILVVKATKEKVFKVCAFIVFNFRLFN